MGAQVGDTRLEDLALIFVAKGLQFPGRVLYDKRPVGLRPQVRHGAAG